MVYIERVLITQIGSSNTDMLYSTDLPESLRVDLTEKYVGRCYKHCYIKEIVEIIHHSPVVLESHRNGGSARIAVKFRVRGIIYDKNEVIPDAKIVEIMEDGSIILRSSCASIMLPHNTRLQHFRVGQVVPVRAIECKYVPYRETISVRSIPFVPIKEEIHSVFKVSAEDHMLLDIVYKRIHSEIKRFATHDKKIQKNWMDFLNPAIKKSGTLVPYEQLRSGLLMPQAWAVVGDTSVYVESTDKAPDRNSIQVLRGYLNSVAKQWELVNTLAEQYEWQEASKSSWFELYKQEK